MARSCRVTALEKALHSTDAPEWLKRCLVNTVGCCTSITLFYDGSKLQRTKLILYLQDLEDKLGDLSSTKVPCRRFKLPISFESKEQEEATKRYMETQRPHAPYLPSNLGKFSSHISGTDGRNTNSWRRFRCT